MLSIFAMLFRVVEKVVVQLLDKLCSNEMTPREHLETQQALFKQFAQLLDFVFKFDEIKVPLET